MPRLQLPAKKDRIVVAHENEGAANGKSLVGGKHIALLGSRIATGIEHRIDQPHNKLPTSIASVPIAQESAGAAPGPPSTLTMIISGFKYSSMLTASSFRDSRAHAVV